MKRWDAPIEKKGSKIVQRRLDDALFRPEKQMLSAAGLSSGYAAFVAVRYRRSCKFIKRC